MIKESIREEMKNTSEVIKSEISDVSKSYASAAKNEPVQNNISDLKTIINKQGMLRYQNKKTTKVEPVKSYSMELLKAKLKTKLITKNQTKIMRKPFSKL